MPARRPPECGARLPGRSCLPRSVLPCGTAFSMASRIGFRLLGRSSAARFRGAATMPQPRSTPTAAGMTACFVAITEPIVAPRPQWASRHRGDPAMDERHRRHVLQLTSGLLVEDDALGPGLDDPTALCLDYVVGHERLYQQCSALRAASGRMRDLTRADNRQASVGAVYDRTVFRPQRCALTERTYTRSSSSRPQRGPIELCDHGVEVIEGQIEEHPKGFLLGGNVEVIGPVPA